MQSVNFRVFHEKRRLIRHVSGDRPVEEIGDTFIEYYMTNAGQITYDVVTDYRKYFGRIDWSILKIYAERIEAMHAEFISTKPDCALSHRRSALVVTDSMARVLVRAMQNLYFSTTLKVFATQSEAEAWLDLFALSATST